MDILVKDLRYAIRNLVNARTFTFIAVLTLALGIGATTAMFTVVHSVLLRPVPFPDPQRLVAINMFNSDHPAPEIPEGNLSYPDYLDIAARNHSFDSVGVYSYSDFTLTGAGPASHVESQLVTSNLFPLLGVQPALGRGFLPEEDGPGHRVVIVSDRLWRAHFNADRTVIGRRIALDGNNYTIVGVMPPGFQIAARETPRDLWITFARSAEFGNTKQRGNHSISGLGRLKRGVSLEQANSDLASIYRALAVEYPNSNTHTGIAACGLVPYIVGSDRTPLLVLMAAVLFVLLIACVNVANLLLARNAARHREIAIRAALGATRIRMLRQLVTESVVLALISGILGTLLAAWAVAAALKVYPANLPRAADIGIDAGVLFFTVATSIATGILFGLLPACRVAAPNLTQNMREGGRASTSGRKQQRTRSALIVAETAVGVVLLIGAGLLIRSLQRLSRVELGLNPDHVLTANFGLSEKRYDPDHMDRFITELLGHLRELPGVTNAAASIPLPLGGHDGWNTGVDLIDHPVPQANMRSAMFYLVTGDIFQTLQIPLVRGRLFDGRDQRNSAPVMIITQQFARKFFPHEDPIGRKVHIGGGEGKGREQYDTREIVGIVGDIRRSNLARSAVPAFYVPLAQMMWGTPTLILRSDRDERMLGSSVAKVLASLDPGAPLYNVRSMKDWLALDLGRARFQSLLLGSFAGMALLLTAIGLYGVISYSVSQRTQEIGVRMALGASRSSVLSMVMNDGIRLTVCGLILGVAGSLALARIIASLLYQTSPRDPVAYGIVAVLLLAVSLLASCLPALRASRVDPMVALRYE